MNPATRARAVTTARPVGLPRPGRWAVPLVLVGLALSACSLEPRGATPGSGSNPSGSPTDAEPATVPSTNPPPSASPERPDAGTTAIRVVVGDRTFTGELYDNPTARDLADQLPLTVTMDDLHGTEKTGPLPRALTTDGAPRGSDPEVGEIGYYAPGRDLVLYYGEMGYYTGIVRIGRFGGSLDGLAEERDGFSARVELE